MLGLCFWFVNVFRTCRPPYISHARHYNEVNTQPTNGITFAVAMTSFTGEKSPRTRILSFIDANLSLLFIHFRGAADMCVSSVLQVTGNNQVLSYVIKGLFASRVSKKSIQHNVWKEVFHVQYTNWSLAIKWNQLLFPVRSSGFGIYG